METAIKELLKVMLMAVIAGIVMPGCSDDKSDDFRGTWYLEGSGGETGYIFEGSATSGTGFYFEYGSMTDLKWYISDGGILTAINADTYDTIKVGSASIKGGDLYWDGEVFTGRITGSGSGTGSGDWAPSSMVSKIISWSELNSDGTAGNSDVRVKFDNGTDMSTNFSDWTTYTYTKKSSKKAHLNFMAPQMAGSVVRTFQYDIDIKFTSAETFEVSGTLIVNYLSGPNVGRTYYYTFTGNGKYVSSLYGDS